MKPVQLDHRKLAEVGFAVIDPLQGDEESLAMWAQWTRHPLVPAGYEAQADEFPQLIHIASSQDRQRLTGLLIDKGSTAAAACCVALLKTSADIERMSRHMRRMLAPSFPDQRRAVFRFYDPVVLEHLSWMLDKRSLAALCGPVREWLFPVSKGWQSLCPDESTHVNAAGFILNATQWGRVRRIGVIHAALERVPEWRDAPARWGSQAEAFAERAEKHQLSERKDIIAFIGHGLRCHPRFDEHPRVAQLLSDSVKHPMRFHRTSQQWTAENWLSIHNDLQPHTSDTFTHAVMGNPPQGVQP